MSGVLRLAQRRMSMSLQRGPDRLDRMAIRELARQAITRVGPNPYPERVSDKERIRLALRLLESIPGLCDRLDDAEELLSARGKKP